MAPNFDDEDEEYRELDFTHSPDGTVSYGPSEDDPAPSTEDDTTHVITGGEGLTYTPPATISGEELDAAYNSEDELDPTDLTDGDVTSGR